jgi:hypothetical protein
MASPGDLDALPPTELKALVEVHLDRLPSVALAAEHLAGARDTDLAGREVGTDARLILSAADTARNDTRQRGSVRRRPRRGSTAWDVCRVQATTNRVKTLVPGGKDKFAQH